MDKLHADFSPLPLDVMDGDGDDDGEMASVMGFSGFGMTSYLCSS